MIDPKANAGTVLGVLPTWVLMAASLLLPRPPRITISQLISYHDLLDDLLMSLPEPETFWQALIFRRLVTWINRQKEEVRRVIDLDVVIWGVIPKD